jgi:hypothetical protein
MANQMTALDATQRRVSTDLGSLLATGALVALLSANPILVLVYGALEMKGNAICTGAFFMLSELAILTFSFSYPVKLKLPDCLFFSFLVSIAISTTLTLNVGSIRDWALLLVTLSAYGCCRFIKADQLGYIRSFFIRSAVPIVIVGTIATTYSLVLQWDDPHGKPIVFGFDAWATYFLGTLGLFTIAVASTKLDLRKTLTISAFIFLPMVVFSASGVRFTFLAILGGLFVATLFSNNKQRIYIAIIAAVTVASITFGLFARSNVTSILFRYAVEEIHKRKDASVPLSKESNAPPSCGLDVNEFNSIAVRKALLRDGIYLAPKAGLFGFGLQAFETYSCVPHTEVHITLLQTIIEFGWLGALAFVSLILSVSMPLMRRARVDDASRWLLCWLGYELALGFAYGRMNEQVPLFLMIGIATVTSGASQKTDDESARGFSETTSWRIRKIVMIRKALLGDA